MFGLGRNNDPLDIFVEDETAVADYRCAQGRDIGPSAQSHDQRDNLYYYTEGS